MVNIEYGANLPPPMRPMPSGAAAAAGAGGGDYTRPTYQPSAPALSTGGDAAALATPSQPSLQLPHLKLHAPPAMVSDVNRTHEHQHQNHMNYQLEQLQFNMQQQQQQQEQLPQPQATQIDMKPGQSLLIQFDANQQNREPEALVNFQWHISPRELKFERELARGTFGSVHAGSFRRTPVAIKQLHGSSLTAQQHQEFRAEVGILMRLHHPNIVLFLGFTQDDSTRQYYMIFEFMERGTVWDLVHKAPGGPVKFDLLVSILRDAATGMFYLHSMNPPIIHRDFKSPNLLLDRAYRCKLADFGLSRTKRHLGQKMTSAIGTFQYMAPEVIQGQSYGEPADVFSFGLVMWEMVSGTQPYPNLDNMQVAYQCVSGIRPAIPPGVPEVMNRLIQACWQSNPELRPSYGFILDQLAAFQ